MHAGFFDPYFANITLAPDIGKKPIFLRNEVARARPVFLSEQAGKLTMFAT